MLSRSSFLATYNNLKAAQRHFFLFKRTAVDMGDAKSFVEGKIAGKKVMVFSKTYCPYCSMAKNVLKQYKLSPADYEVLEIENRSDCNQIQAYLKQKTGASSVPRVFINGKCIGGGTETEAAHSSGKLKQLLA